MRGGHPRYGPANVLDRDRATYWTTDEGVRTGELTIRLPGRRTVSIVRCEEGIALGQRIETFAVDVWLDGAWRTVAEATTVGPRRILRLAPVVTDRLRVRITKSAAPPVLTEVCVY